MGKSPRKIAQKLALAKPLKLELGCGNSKAGPDWTGVDSRQFEGVDLVADLTKPWPWADNSVDEIRASHFVEHLEAGDRIHFVNEAFRVLKPGATAQIITPHWNSCRAYGDLTHKWPPVSEFWFNYLNRAWREANAPHGDAYTCDFELPPVLALNIHPGFHDRNQEYQQWAANHLREGASDLMATITKPGGA
jgi:hypothetical protein